jgi:catechol 2,3-dioxygenase-like lactoylglutathione lyase family enzyme
MSTALHAVRKPHLSLNVRDVDAAVAFYRAFFGTSPVKHYHDKTTVHSVLQDDTGRDSRRTRTGYAKFDLETPALNFVLNQIPGTRLGPKGTLSHLGLQVDSTEDVIAMRERVVAAGLTPRDEMAVSCCFARQDKFWLADPDGNEWEVFTVLEHLTPEQLQERDTRGACDTGCATSCTPKAEEVACCAG